MIVTGLDLEKVPGTRLMILIFLYHTLVQQARFLAEADHAQAHDRFLDRARDLQLALQPLSENNAKA